MGAFNTCVAGIIKLEDDQNMHTVVLVHHPPFHWQLSWILTFKREGLVLRNQERIHKPRETGQNINRMSRVNCAPRPDRGWPSLALICTSVLVDLSSSPSSKYYIWPHSQPVSGLTWVLLSCKQTRCFSSRKWFKRKRTLCLPSNKENCHYDFLNKDPT